MVLLLVFPYHSVRSGWVGCSEPFHPPARYMKSTVCSLHLVWMGWVHQRSKPLSRTVMPLSRYSSFCHVPVLSVARRLQEHPPSRGSLCANRGQLFLKPFTRTMWGSYTDLHLPNPGSFLYTKPHCHKKHSDSSLMFLPVSSVLVKAQIFLHSFAWCQVNRSELSSDLICLFQKFWQNISISLIFLQIKISKAGHLCQLSKDSSGLANLILFAL